VAFLLCGQWAAQQLPAPPLQGARLRAAEGLLNRCGTTEVSLARGPRARQPSVRGLRHTRSQLGRPSTDVRGPRTHFCPSPLAPAGLRAQAGKGRRTSGSGGWAAAPPGTHLVAGQPSAPAAPAAGRRPPTPGPGPAPRAPPWGLVPVPPPSDRELPLGPERPRPQ
jgi:hypothetical protein